MKKLILISCIVLAACGGGSGDNISPIIPSVVTPPIEIIPPVVTPPIEVGPPTMEEDMRNRINVYRKSGATCGITIFSSAEVVILNNSLNIAAANHSIDMAKNNFFSHTGSNGSSFWDREYTAGFKGQPRGEAIAAGTYTPEDTLNLWMNSPPHCSIIMDSSMNTIGIGKGQNTNSQYGIYWTLDTGYDKI